MKKLRIEEKKEQIKIYVQKSLEQEKERQTIIFENNRILIIIQLAFIIFIFLKSRDFSKTYNAILILVLYSSLFFSLQVYFGDYKNAYKRGASEFLKHIKNNNDYNYLYAYYEQDTNDNEIRREELLKNNNKQSKLQKTAFVILEIFLVLLFIIYFI